MKNVSTAKKNSLSIAPAIKILTGDKNGHT